MSDKVSKLTELVEHLERPDLKDDSISIQNFQMRIAANGVWYYQGTPINRIALVKLFAKVLHKDDSGQYWLITPVERGLIEVDDTPFLAVELNKKTGYNFEHDVLRFRTNLDEEFDCGPKNPLRVEIDPVTHEPRPYVLVRDGLEARLTTSVFYQLVEMSGEYTIDGKKVLGVWSEATFFPLGPINMESTL